MKKYNDLEFRDALKNDEMVFKLNDPQFKKFLELIGTKVENGVLVDSKTKIKEHFNTQEDVKYRDVSGIMAGSKIFLKKSVADLSDYLTEKNSE